MLLPEDVLGEVVDAVGEVADGAVVVVEDPPVLERVVAVPQRVRAVVADVEQQNDCGNEAGPGGGEREQPCHPWVVEQDAQWCGQQGQQDREHWQVFDQTHRSPSACFSVVAASAVLSASLSMRSMSDSSTLP